MKAEKSKLAGDPSTEEKIKKAAQIVFHKKGFAAARTRDIAQEAGINLALLNYYFRSKEKLFNIVMIETFRSFFESVTIIINNPDTTFEKKIELFASGYIDLLLTEPDIPIFIISEIRNNPEELLQKMDIKSAVFNSVFARQFHEAVNEGRIKDQNFVQFTMNIMGLIVFPFVAKPMLKALSDLTEDQFNKIIEERKTLIPVWIKAMMN
ncbi:MAG: TetR/AcrR family transcriptional regulator [Draconibacterium sp.]|nr:TetR/AcrR family transcriptional regulator [Draconibacterium sp.]